MDFTVLESALEERFFVPLKRSRTRRVGVELELPICNRDPARPVDFDVVQSVTERFLSEFVFAVRSHDGDGRIYRAGETVYGDELSFDCSYNTVEFSFGPMENLNEVLDRFMRYYSFFKDELLRRGHTVTGMGVNPRWRVNRAEPINSSRYRMLLRYLKSYPKYHRALPFHCWPHFGLFSCASQVQLDVDESTALQAVNTFTRLEPFKSVLFANSPFGDRLDLLCARDYFWRDSLHGLNPHNCDLYRLPFHRLKDIRSYLTTTSLYAVERDGRYIHFAPRPLQEYFFADTIEGEAVVPGGFERVTFVPCANDVRFLRPFKFEDLTYRGTLEFRSVCAQPVPEVLAFAAFHAGLMEMLSELATLLDDDETLYGHGYNVSELRELFNRQDWPLFVDRPALSRQLQRILDLAATGCSRRGANEEVLLAPLYRRAETLVSPAREYVDGLKKGDSVDDFIARFG